MLVNVSARRLRSAFPVSLASDIVGVNAMLTDCSLPATANPDMWPAPRVVEAAARKRKEVITCSIKPYKDDNGNEHTTRTMQSAAPLQGSAEPTLNAGPTIPVVWRNSDRLLCIVRIPVPVLVDILGQIAESTDRSEDTIWQFSQLAMMLSAFKLNRENRYIRDGLRVGRDNFVEWTSENRSEAAQTAIMGMLFPDLAFATGSPCVMSGTLTSRVVDVENRRGLAESVREFCFQTDSETYVFSVPYVQNADGSMLSERIWSNCEGKTRFVFHVKNGNIAGNTFRPAERSTIAAQMIGKGKRIAYRPTYQVQRINGKAIPVATLHGLNENRNSKLQRLFGLQFDLHYDLQQLVNNGEMSQNWFDIVQSLYDAECDRLNGSYTAPFKYYSDYYCGYMPERTFNRERHKVIEFVKTQFIGEREAKAGNIRTYRVSR